MKSIINDIDYTDAIEHIKSNLSFGYSNEDIDIIIKTLIDYDQGILKHIPLEIFDLICPVLPKNDDYEQYDDILKLKISKLTTPFLKQMATGLLISDSPMMLLASKIRKTRSIHQSRSLYRFNLKKRLALVDQGEFESFFEEYFVNKNLKITFEWYKIPPPFIPQIRDDDNFPYYERC